MVFSCFDGVVFLRVGVWRAPVAGVHGQHSCLSSRKFEVLVGLGLMIRFLLLGSGGSGTVRFLHVSA